MGDVHSDLYSRLPMQLRGQNARHMSWVWDVFLQIHDIELWVWLEVLAESPMGKVLETHVQAAIRRVQLILQGLDNDEADDFSIFAFPPACGVGVHAEMQQLFYLQQNPPCRFPYIGISFPPCRHCALMLACIAITYREQPVLCQHRGCSGRMYGTWSLGAYMKDSVIACMLGPELSEQFFHMPSSLQWTSSGQLYTSVFECPGGPKSAVHAVDALSELTICLLTQELKSVQKWLVRTQGAKPMVEGSL
jgi:hypothetical protein